MTTSPTIKPPITSWTLTNLGREMDTVCESCPNAIWQVNRAEKIQVYCKLMHVLVDQRLLSCDGNPRLREVVEQAEAEAKAALEAEEAAAKAELEAAEKREAELELLDEEYAAELPATATSEDEEAARAALEAQLDQFLE